MARDTRDTRDNRETRVGTEDVLPVHSRISWGALLAGLFVTLAVFVLLSTLGVAVGLSAADTHTERDNIAVGAGIWAILTALIAFFCGGCVTTRLTAGENRGEAIMYGVVMWGAAFAMILWMTGSALRTGATAAVGSANVAANQNPNAASQAAQGNWEQAARDAKVSDAQIAQMREKMPTAAQAQDVSAKAAWWSFAGVVLSLAAAIGGALASAGPESANGSLFVRRTTVVAAPG